MKQKYTKREREGKIKEIEIKILKLREQEMSLVNFEKKRRLYSPSEAISLMRNGRYMAMTSGHIWESGYFYGYNKGEFIGHNGDGTINRKDIDIEGLKDSGKEWVIVAQEDFKEKFKIKEEIKYKYIRE